MEFKDLQMALNETEDEGPIEKIDVDKSDVINKNAKVKKLFLIPDIFDDILARILSTTSNSEKSTGLQKFLLSGKESLKAVLRLFSKLLPDYVAIRRDNFDIHFEKKYYFQVSYDFPYLKHILSVISSSNNTLMIYYYPENAAGKSVLAHFTNKDLKTLELRLPDNTVLPADYIRFFKNECNFSDSIYAYHCSIKKPTLFDMLTMKSAEHTFLCHFHPFLTNLLHIEEGKLFPEVHELRLYEHDKCTKNKNLDIYSVESIKDFFGQLCLHFPNLIYLNVNMECAPYDISTEWPIAYEALLAFDQQMFSYIPSRIKGKVHFILDDYETKFDDVIEIYGENTDVDTVVNQRHGYTIVNKKFEIHEGLEFCFQISFN